MPSDDDKTRRPVTHQVGENLDALSIVEIDERITLLRAEIARLETAKASKQGALAAVSSFFKT
jgi:uncharacterized small protein (DUF1192 family)